MKIAYDIAVEAEVSAVVVLVVVEGFPINLDNFSARSQMEAVGRACHLQIPLPVGPRMSDSCPGLWRTAFVGHVFWRCGHDHALGGCSDEKGQEQRGIPCVLPSWKVTINCTFSFFNWTPALKRYTLFFVLLLLLLLLLLSLSLLLLLFLLLVFPLTQPL